MSEALIQRVVFENPVRFLGQSPKFDVPAGVETTLRHAESVFPPPSRMRLAPGPLQLTYCTNIHAADGWAAVDANIRRFAPALKARFRADAPFGIGLRLSARDAAELASRTPRRISRVSRSRRPVRRDHQRLSVRRRSTARPSRPTSTRPTGATSGACGTRSISSRSSQQLAARRHGWRRLDRAALVQGLDRRRSRRADWRHDDARTSRASPPRSGASSERTGTVLHLDIEPEPDCVLETIDETIAFFQRWLWPDGALGRCGRHGRSAWTPRGRPSTRSRARVLRLLSLGRRVRRSDRRARSTCTTPAFASAACSSVPRSRCPRRPMPPKRRVSPIACGRSPIRPTCTR